MSSSSPSFQTESHFHSVGSGFGLRVLFGLLVCFGLVFLVVKVFVFWFWLFFVKVICSKRAFSKISLGNLKTETGTLHATEGSKDVRSMSRETLEKQLIPLKPKKLLAIFS